jgi:hypothetical protein
LLQTGWKAVLTALGEFASPHADHGAIFGQTVLHRGDDLIGKRNLRIDRRQTRWRRCLRWVSGPGFERIELMLEVREGLFQISRFLSRGDLVPYDTPRTMPVFYATHPRLKWRGRLSTACPQQENNVVLDLGEANLALILASIGQEANAEEAEYHHCPG